MKVDELKEEIKAYAAEIGIDKIGFAAADVFSELRERLRRQQELNYQSGFEKGTIEERTEPQRLLPEAQSIISIALAYPSRMKNAPKGTKENRRGIFARASWGVDYHVVLQNRLQKLESFIKEKVPNAVTKIMVDTGELSDRAVAERAGIGFSGKNCAIITEEYGSFVYLGEMMTNIPFVPDEPVEDSCGDCRKCIDACPTGALIDNGQIKGGQINAQRCISFLTQTKDFMPEEFRIKIGNRLYGCDTCQQVCPRNKGMDFHIHAEFEPNPEVAKPLLKPMLRISNREFREKFSYMSGAWRGKKPIQRNALIALGHFKDESAIEEMVEVMKNDPRPVIRGTAAWSLGKIGTEAAIAALKEAMQSEKDEQVLFEMERGLEMAITF